MFKNRVDFFSAPSQPHMHQTAADAACAAEQYVPGAQKFVQQLFRAKAEFLKGVAALVNAEVEQIERLDATFDQSAAHTAGAPAACSTTEKIPVE